MSSGPSSDVSPHRSTTRLEPRWFDHRLAPSHRTSTAVALLAVIAVIGLVDYFTGPLISLTVLYIVPTATATVLLGSRAGRFVAVLCGVMVLLSDVVLRPQYGHRLVASLNAVFMVVTLELLVALLTALQSEVHRAVRAERRTHDFLAVAAHQLRTPIARLRSGAEALVIAGPADPEIEDVMSDLTRDAAHAGTLISSLLRVARLDGNEPLESRAVDIVGLIEDEVDRVRRARTNDLTWHVTSTVAERVAMCDPDAVREAFVNLVDNAARHAATTVDVTIDDDHGAFVIGVADDGPGLDADAAARAFQRFVSLDNSGGSGLGLPIAQGVFEAHGGTLTYVDHTFRARLPRTPPRDAGGETRRRRR